MNVQRAIEACDECSAKSATRPLSYLVIRYILSALAEPSCEHVWDWVPNPTGNTDGLNLVYCYKCKSVEYRRRDIAPGTPIEVTDIKTEKSFNAGIKIGEKSMLEKMRRRLEELNG